MIDNLTLEEIEDISKQEDNSITNPGTIRKITLLSLDGDKSLICKIKEEYSLCGLYPRRVIDYDILPDGFNGCIDNTKEMLEYLLSKRNKKINTPYKIYDK